MPTVGSIFAPDYYPPRDYLVNGPYPYSDFEYVLDGKYTNEDGSPGTASAGVSYRVLIRSVPLSSLALSLVPHSRVCSP